jgi:hypothetical protein
LSADRQLRSLDTRTPADENILCNDQSTARKKVVDQMHGPTLYFKDFFIIFFFLPTIRLGKIYSNVDGIEE